MLKIITSFLDLLFPPRDTELLLKKIPSDTRSLAQYGIYAGVEFIAQYTNPYIKALIKENKYHHSQIASTALASLVEIYLVEVPADHIVLIPIPQSRERAREREHNQVETILSHLTQTERISIRTDILSKSRHTPTQASLTRDKRIENVKDSFSCNSNRLTDFVKGTVIYIVDDVVTTGATMKAARASLAPHLPPGVTIKLLAIAH